MACKQIANWLYLYVYPATRPEGLAKRRAWTLFCSQNACTCQLNKLSNRLPNTHIGEWIRMTRLFYSHLTFHNSRMKYAVVVQAITACMADPGIKLEQLMS
jgi:hypothetical protein